MGRKGTGLENCKQSLEGELTIFRAAELKKELDSLLQNCTELELDLSGISEVDTAGVQLLIFAKAQMAEKSGTLKLNNHSEAMVEALDLYDLNGYFGDPVLLSSKRRGELA